MRNDCTYDYFISYRRAGGGALEAQWVKSILYKYGKKVFLYVDDTKAGEFQPQIFDAIEQSKDFILILNEESWRDTVKKYIYYEEIIKISQQDGKIVPIEFAKGVLDNVPDILQEHLEWIISKFEKVSCSQDEDTLFEKSLCDRLGLPYSPDFQIENLSIDDCSLNNSINYQKLNGDEQTVLRHFVLWQSEYISFDIISDLLKDTCLNLNEALDSLVRRSILNYYRKDNTAYYKLNRLFADSLRKQIKVTKQDYSKYIDNIKRIICEHSREFTPYADCIGNSLCKYKIITSFSSLIRIGKIFRDACKLDYAKRLFKKSIDILETEIANKSDNIGDLKYLSHAYTILADLEEKRLKDYESAEKSYYNAIETNKRIVEQSSYHEHRYGLARAYYNLAFFQGATLNDIATAEQNFTRTIDKMEAIKDFLCEVIGIPGPAKYWRLLSSAEQNLYALKSKDSLERIYDDVELRFLS